MLSESIIKLDTSPQTLRVDGLVVRQVAKEDEEDSGWRLQTVITNVSNSTMGSLDVTLRYYNFSGEYIGHDESLLFLEKISPGDDFATTVPINLPADTKEATLFIKAEKITLINKYGAGLCIIGAVVAALLFFLAKFLD